VVASVKSVANLVRIHRLEQYKLFVGNSGHIDGSRRLELLRLTNVMLGPYGFGSRQPLARRLDLGSRSNYAKIENSADVGQFNAELLAPLDLLSPSGNKIGVVEAERARR
jgi:hypothetical protein